VSCGTKTTTTLDIALHTCIDVPAAVQQRKLSKAEIDHPFGSDGASVPETASSTSGK
jgi:hypothetical protein